MKFFGENIEFIIVIKKKEIRRNAYLPLVKETI